MQISKEVTKAYTEVLSVLNELEEEDYNKIPKEKIELYNKLSDKEYVFKYNKKEFLDTQISEKAKAIIASIFIRYIANDEERDIIRKKQRETFLKEEKQKESIVLNDLFANNSVEVINNKPQMELMVVKKDNFFTRIIRKVKKLLGADKNENI